MIRPRVEVWTGFITQYLSPLLQTEKLKLKRAELPTSDATLNLESFGVFACLVCGTVSHYVPLVALKVTM